MLFNFDKSSFNHNSTSYTLSVPCCAVSCRVVLVLCCFGVGVVLCWCCVVLRRIVLYCIVLSFAALYCVELCCAVLCRFNISNR